MTFLLEFKRGIVLLGTGELKIKKNINLTAKNNLHSIIFGFYNYEKNMSLEY